MFRRSISVIICGESGWSARNVGVLMLSVSQPPSITAATIAADAKSERTSGRRFKPETPPEQGYPEPWSVNGYRLKGLTARQPLPRDSRFSMPMVNEW
jgi:hypothetical protein